MKLWNLKSIVSSLLILASTAAEDTTKPCEDMELIKLPAAYATTIMMNIQLGREKGFSLSMYEASDSNLGKSFISVYREMNILNPITNTTEPRLIDEMILFNPELGGIDYFIDVYTGGADGLYGQICDADKVREGSILEWLFGWTPGSGVPSVAGMLHFGGQYTAGCPTVFRGVEVNTFKGIWNISEWDALLEVKYYWSNPQKWYGSAGRDISVPVSAVLEGDATIMGERDHIKIEIDYSDFIEISLPREFYYPPKDLWCHGRGMDDPTPEVPAEISYTEEIIMKWLDAEAKPIDVIIPRNVWLDYSRMITRTDYKPIDATATNPFDGNTGNVQQIDDFLTGLSYTISQDYGNCSVGYLPFDQTGTVIDEHGRPHIKNPFFMMNFNKFAFNGEYHERGIEIDSFMRNAKPFGSHDDDDFDNQTTVFFLSSSNWEIEDGEDLPERLIPTKVVSYPTEKYNDPFLNVKMNVFHFSKVRPDFSLYDISACFEENQMMHLMVRMGWREDMDIENTRKLFNDEVRNAVTMWGKVTHIRVVNIEFDIDFDNAAVFVLWTVLDYPRDVDVELGDIPDAIRPLKEIKDNIKTAVDKGWFTIKVSINDGKGGTVKSQAEAGSLRELGDRGSEQTHKSGYRAGSMAALGIVMLILTVGGILALLVFVLKW